MNFLENFIYKFTKKSSLSPSNLTWDQDGMFLLSFFFFTKFQKDFHFSIIQYEYDYYMTLSIEKTKVL